jgi:hypothetical protein
MDGGGMIVGGALGVGRTGVAVAHEAMSTPMKIVGKILQ